MSTKTWLEISEGAIQHNFTNLQKIAAGKAVMPIIKANGYGHGLIEVAQVLNKAGVKWFGVDSTEEALTLRKNGFQQSILVLGVIPRDQIETVIENGVSFVLFNEDQLSYIEARRGEGKAKVHVPVETGLYREGFELEAFQSVLKRVKDHGKIQLEGVQTHFADIEDTSSSEYADRQLAEYEKYLEIVNEHNIESTLKHTAASAASILYSNTHFDLIRPGLAIYGLWPSDDTRRRVEESHPEFSLQPALTWKTIIAQTKEVRAGERVGYGLTEMLERDSRIAVLPVGYYDGFDRVGLSSRAHVLIRGSRCKVIGRICMNMCMVDVTDVPDAKEGDEAVLLGEQEGERITAEELAEQMQSINYEVVARLGAHIERRLV